MGMRGNQTRSLYFNDIKVPQENILGRIEDGFKIAMKSLDSGRLGIAA
jgi:butyryl-CoA dehydrogenase